MWISFLKKCKKIHHYEEIVNKVQDEVNPEHLEQTKGDAVTVRASTSSRVKTVNSPRVWQPRTIQKIMENQFHIIEMLENLEKKSSSYKQADGSVVDMSNVENALRDLVYEQPVFLFKATDSH